MLVPLGALQWLAVAGVSLLGVAMLVAIGYALAGLPRSLEAGMAMIMITNFVMMFGGNIFWDPQGSVALQVVAHLLPASYLADAYRQLIGGREGLWPLWVDLAAMLAWTALAVTFAVRTFSFDMTPRARRAASAITPLPGPALR
jgi:ABC-2 type transport system permease protein